jgi:predicted DNA-binding transcriptional regulator YafY
MRTIWIDYTNHDGVRRWRQITPEGLRYGSNVWHPEPQYLLSAYDLERDDFRIFAVLNIHAWSLTKPEREPITIEQLRHSISARLEAHLAEMKPEYDDSIVGFNEAWDIVRKAFSEATGG